MFGVRLHVASSDPGKLVEMGACRMFAEKRAHGVRNVHASASAVTFVVLQVSVRGLIYDKGFIEKAPL